MPCWAAPLGDCAGRMTKEHIFTRALFETRQIRVQGAPWTARGSKVIGRDAAVSNVLCDRHNNLLSHGPDKAAVRLRRLLLFSNDPLRRPGSAILQPPPEVGVSGVSFAQWLCKTHCNVMAATHQTPHLAYVHYAFGQKPPEHLWFYFLHHPGRKVVFADTEDNAVARYVYHASDDSTVDACSINLCGFQTLVSRRRIGSLRMILLRGFGVEWHDRLGRLEFPTDLGRYRINFDWTGDPDA